jgi:hypothetical protein
MIFHVLYRAGNSLPTDLLKPESVFHPGSGGQNSTVGIDYATGWTIRGSNPDREADFSLLQNVQTGSVGLIQPSVQWIRQF